MSDYEFDVLICGAGAAGLTLAVDLARRGVSCRLIEKSAVPFHGSRGKGIQPRTLEVFDDLGVVDCLIAAGGCYPPQRQFQADGSYLESQIMEPADPTPAEPYPFPWMVPQFLTERVLRERLRALGHEVQFASELVGLQQDSTSVTAQLLCEGHLRTVRVRYLIGSDGGRSFVRQSLGIAFPGKTLDVRGLVADVHLMGLGRNAWHRFNEASMERQISFCPLAGTPLFQIQAPLPLEGDVDLSLEALSAMVLERTGRREIYLSSVSWASAFQMNARLADRYRVGRVFLAGDAAHTHPPTGGQGLNTSVQDAYNLGWKLGAVLNGAPEALLDSYEDERRPIAADMLGMSTRLLDALKQGDIRRGREVRQLDLSYPESPLNLASPAATGRVSAGDRAPDALMRGSNGSPMRLFDLLRGPHWTLLGYETPQVPTAHPMLHIHRVGAGGDIADPDGYFRDAYFLSPGTWVLVRPDNYIAGIIDSSDVARLRNYLSRVGLDERGNPHD